MQKYKDLSGQKYGRLTVICRAANDKQGNAQWVCLCECGKEKIVRGKSLSTGTTQSCGCFLSESSRKRMKRLMTKHGQSKTLLYHVWSTMNERCSKPSCKEFRNYGARGISVCEEWRTGFIPFYKWAIENGYRRFLVIDRKDNDGPYSPNNCRWVPPIVNAQNTRKCVHVIVRDLRSGETSAFPTISEASRFTQIAQNTIARAVNGLNTRCIRYEFLKG